MSSRWKRCPRSRPRNASVLRIPWGVVRLRCKRPCALKTTSAALQERLGAGESDASGRPNRTFPDARRMESERPTADQAINMAWSR